MKALSLTSVFALAFFATSASAGGMATPPESLELPHTITRSGHQFLAHCDDQAFAQARFPRKLAARCARLLETWRAEASDRGNVAPLVGGIVRFGAPRGIPAQPPRASGNR